MWKVADYQSIPIQPTILPTGAEGIPLGQAGLPAVPTRNQARLRRRYY
ncbi:MAG: hypothetical protein JKX74_06070 [Flavobacteriales bacterium]|nr:hypothetical protein [Flavobacteriales bacterium]